jgi:hypothetical protein
MHPMPMIADAASAIRLRRDMIDLLSWMINKNIFLNRRRAIDLEQQNSLSDVEICPVSGINKMGLIVRRQGLWDKLRDFTEGGFLVHRSRKERR